MNKEKENIKLRELLWELVIAQSRLLDRWSEGDDAYRKVLWADLHSRGAEAREYLESIGSKINSY